MDTIINEAVISLPTDLTNIIVKYADDKTYRLSEKRYLNKRKISEIEKENSEYSDQINKNLKLDDNFVNFKNIFMDVLAINTNFHIVIKNIYIKAYKYFYIKWSGVLDKVFKNDETMDDGGTYYIVVELHNDKIEKNYYRNKETIGYEYCYFPGSNIIEYISFVIKSFKYENMMHHTLYNDYQKQSTYLIIWTKYVYRAECLDDNSEL